MKRLKEFINESIGSIPELIMFMGAFFGIQTGILLWIQKRFKNDIITGIVGALMVLTMTWFISFLANGNN